MREKFRSPLARLIDEPVSLTLNASRRHLQGMIVPHRSAVRVDADARHRLIPNIHRTSAPLPAAANGEVMLKRRHIDRRPRRRHPCCAFHRARPGRLSQQIREDRRAVAAGRRRRSLRARDPGAARRPARPDRHRREHRRQLRPRRHARRLRARSRTATPCAGQRHVRGDRGAADLGNAGALSVLRAGVARDLGPQGLFTHPRSGLATAQAFAAAAKANPGKLNIGVPGLGSSQHLTSELLLRACRRPARHARALSRAAGRLCRT